MRFVDISTALGALSLFSLGVNASPVDHELFERQNSFFALTGASGGISPRQEVRDLANNPDQWNLFVLAMQRFQSKNQNDKFSWYSISGIHGRPYANWDGVGPYGSSPWWPGYCPHSSNLFGSWHRPYLSLYEQLLIQYANEIINETPPGNARSRLQAAVGSLRLPYWDWAMKSPNGAVIPDALMQPNIQVTYPQNGSSTIIPNPLYAYRFQVVPDNNFESNYARNRQTFRSSNAESNLQASYTSRRNNLITLFSRNQGYNTFSTDANNNQNTNLEGIHNSVHSAVGGYMQQIAYSAMDPIFAMHHANIDRVIAIWQALYPNNWVTYATQGSGTRTMAPSSGQDGNSPLTPFHRDTFGTFWTSNAVRDTRVFGYTYPDLIGISGSSQLISNLNQMYGSSVTNSALRAGADADASAPAVTYDYMAQVTLDKSVLGGQPYEVQFSLDGQYVASYAALAIPPPPGVQRKIVTSSGSVMLTDVLAQKNINTADRDSTEQYLAEKLKWQVVQNDQVVASCPGLNVTVSSAEVKPAKTVSQFAIQVEPPQPIDNSTSPA